MDIDTFSTDRLTISSDELDQLARMLVPNSEAEVEHLVLQTETGDYLTVSSPAGHSGVRVSMGEPDDG